MTVTENTYWDGLMPDAIGSIASLFEAHTSAQIDQCEILASFLIKDKDTRNLDSLNFDTSKTPYIVAMLDSSRNVRIIYGIGTGAGLMGLTTHNLETNILALTGEYMKDSIVPSVVVFPPSVLNPTEIRIPTDTEMEEVFKTHATKPFFFKHKNLTESVTIPTIIPIPAFLVYDGFDMDIDALVIYERIMSIFDKLDEELPTTLPLLIAFLRNVIVDTTQKDNTVHQSPNLFMSMPHPMALTWKKRKQAAMFPEIFARTAPTTTPPAWSEEAIINLIKAARASPQEEKKDDDESTTDTRSTLGLSTLAFRKLLIMCGLSAGQEDEIPNMWQQLNEKNLQKVDKIAIARNALESDVQWKGAKVMPLHSLLTMLVMRTWEGETSMSSLYSAAKGLTPFAVPCLTEAEVDLQNELTDALSTATSTTVKDITATKIKATTTPNFQKLIKRLQRFGNLLLPAFGDGCPMLQCIETIVEALDDYNDTAIKSTTKRTIASILWIVHLQSRHFANGKMIGDTAFLPEFALMIQSIKSKQPIVHGEVPTSLYIDNNDTKKRNHNEENKIDPKKIKTEPPNEVFVLLNRDASYHSKIKEAMKPFTSMHRLPKLASICKAAGVFSGNLFPKRNNLCIKSQILGKCYSNCPHDHIKVSDEEATKALAMLKSVIDQPNKINKVI